MLNPLKLFDSCFKVPEKLLDPCYFSDKLIISMPPCEPTEIMRAHKIINERIIACKVAKNDRNTAAFERQIIELKALLGQKDVNFIEFTSFWPTLDISVSLYQGLPDKEKVKFLRFAVERYLKTRHSFYQHHGHSVATIQVRKDSAEHKVGASLAVKKFKKLLLEEKYTESAESFFDCKRKTFFFLDKTKKSKMALSDLKKKFNLKFGWQKSYQAKAPDLVFVTKSGLICICEIKHKKEGGGGQNSAIKEIITFIGQRESAKRVSYLALMDGYFFNSLQNPKSEKIQKQVEDIRRALKSRKRNYFVNTYGFKLILQH